MTTNLKPMNTAQEVAEYLGVSKAHLARLRCFGDGPPFIKLGADERAAIRYRKEDILAFIEDRKRLSTSQKMEVAS